MRIIGLTGPSGAGKGHIASLFSRYGVPSIDTDAVYHDLCLPPSECLDELVERFGADILTSEGALDRGALAAIVFAPGAEEALVALNRISHRHVLAKVREHLKAYEAAGASAVLVDAPQLYESGFDRECDYVLAVLAPPDVRLARIMARDGMTRARAEARMAAQRSDDFFRATADAVIRNDGTADLDAEVRRLLDAWEVPYVL